MAFFQNSGNVVLNGGTFNVAHTHIQAADEYVVHSNHSYNVQATNIENACRNQINQTRINTPTPGFTTLSSAPSDSVVSPYASIDQNVQQFISSVEGVSDALEIEDGSKIEEIDNAEDVASDDDRLFDRAYFLNCQAVYVNSFNARGVKVRDSGNHSPKYRGGTVVVRPSNDKQPTYIYTNEGASSINSSQSAALAQSSRSLDVLLDSTVGSPAVIPPLPFQLSSSAQSGPPSSVPAIEIPKQSRNNLNNPFLNQFMVASVPPADIPLPTPEEALVSMSSRKRDELPATIGTKVMPMNGATSHFSPKMPATTTLPGPEFQPFPVNPFLPMHMGLHPSFLLPPNLESLPGTIQNASMNNNAINPWRDTDPQHHPAEFPASNSSRYPLDTNSKRLEHHLDSALATALTIQTSGISSSADILSPRAHNTLKALKALVSVEMPVSNPRTVANDPPARFKYFEKVTKWLRIPQSPKQDTSRMDANDGILYLYYFTPKPSKKIKIPTAFRKSQAH